MMGRRNWIAAFIGLLVAAGSMAFPTAVVANPSIVVDMASGRVLHDEEATRLWYPASLSKLMTAYTVFKAIKAGRVEGGTPVAISPTAANQAPSKMGYPIGTMITIDDALKMLIVKSANDIAVALAEGAAGSVDAFAAEMNAHSQALGMTQSHWVNPNGLPDPAQVTSARDMAILARAIMTEFPQYASLFQIHAIRAGNAIMRNHNSLVYRYPGGDGMKTGFICASGYNLVATARRDGRHLITVVLGATSDKQRGEKAAQLFEDNFKNPNGSVGGATLAQLTLSNAQPADIRDAVCRKRGGTGGYVAPPGMILTEVPSQGADGRTVYTLLYQPKKIRGKKGRKNQPQPIVQQAAVALPPGLLLTSWSLNPAVSVGPYMGDKKPVFMTPELVAFVAAKAAAPANAAVTSFADSSNAANTQARPKKPGVNPLANIPSQPLPAKAKPKPEVVSAKPSPKPVVPPGKKKPQV